jgi:hypothetical protein
MPDPELTPAAHTSRRARRRDEQVRRMCRRLRRADPGLDSPAAALGVRRLAQLSLLAEKLYARCKLAEAGDDPQQFIVAVESFRRCAQTASVIERNLRLAVNIADPQPDFVAAMARTIRERRAAAGTEIVFTPANGDGRN